MSTHKPLRISKKKPYRQVASLLTNLMYDGDDVQYEQIECSHHSMPSLTSTLILVEISLGLGALKETRFCLVKETVWR